MPRVRPVRSSVAPNGLEAPQMIVIGVDVHKHSVTAVAVDEVGRQLDCSRDERTTKSWSSGRSGLAGGSLWALEDCRHVTRGLERTLHGLGPLPGADDLSSEQAQQYAQAIERLPAPTAEEATALVDLLPPDESTSFGLAWSLVHAIESCREWPVWEALDDETPWRSVLRERATGS